MQDFKLQGAVNMVSLLAFIFSFLTKDKYKLRDFI